MRKDFKGHRTSGGIYRITNALNGRVYIGSTCRFWKRAEEHASGLKRGKHPNVFLQRDYAVCGVDAFAFEVLLVIGDARERLDVETAMIAERFGRGCYNMCTPLASTARLPVSEETRQKIRLSRLGTKHTDEQKAKIGAASRGRKASEETRAKMSASQKLRPHGPTSAETRMKMSAAAAGKPKSEAHKAALKKAWETRSRAHLPASVQRMADATRGKPWSPARRAAHEARGKTLQ